MQRKTVVFFILFTVVCSVFGLAGISSAKEVKTYDELYKLLPGYGSVDHAGAIDRALKIVIKMQEIREQRIVNIEKPKDLQVLNPRFLSVSFDAEVRKPGSAKAKPVPAVYALLFEKDAKNELTLYKSISLVWLGSKDIEEFKTVSPDKLCEYYRAKGADYVYLDKKVEPVKPEEMVLNGSSIKAGMISEQFIDSSITRDSEMKAVLEGYVQKEVEKTRTPDEASRMQQLEARIKKLETLLSNVSRSGSDLVFSNVNVVINNGSGVVGKASGTGNLVVGYGDPGSGSHNVLVGSKNRCSSFGSVVTGVGNSVSGKFAGVVGGANNSASGDYGVVLGGHENISSGTYSSILGGSDNKAKGSYTSINGQKGRTKVSEGDNKHFQND